MKKNRALRISAIAAAWLLALSGLTACSANSNSGNDNAYAPEDNFSKPESADGVTGGSEGEWDASQGLTGDYERKIIRTVTMSCETKAYDEAISVIMTTLSAYGGYVENSSTTGTGYEDVKHSERRATYTLRVPAEKLDNFLEALRADEGIRILSQDATSNEITATYYDTVSRLETLEAEKNSLTAMLAGFTDYSDINAMLRVQERLYDVIEEIEALQTKLNLYDGQVSMSTVKLTLREVITYTAVVVEEPSFGERISEAFKESWADFGEGCQNFAVGFVAAFPSLLVLAVIFGGIAVIIAVIVRKNAKKAKARQTGEHADPNPVPPYRPTDKK